MGRHQDRGYGAGNRRRMQNYYKVIKKNNRDFVEANVIARSEETLQSLKIIVLSSPVW